jgi:ABC-2 type transport system ATP-binding protein
MDAIRTHDLSKSYDAKLALAGVNLRVPAGSLFGFLGPNGAGKTTTIRILLGLLRASDGTAEVLGRDAWQQGPALRADVGYLPGDVRFHEHMTGRATLRFLDAVRGGRSGPEIERLARRLDLELDRRIRDYSRGMKQKLGLIQALMHRPRLIILDEPTTALDPLVRQTLYELLREAQGAGRTVLFSSHTLSEVAELCDRVAILRDGLLIEQDRIATLRERAVRHVEVRFRAGTARPPAPAGLRCATREDERLSATWVGTVQPLLAWLATCAVEDVTIGAPNLEDLFLAYYSTAGAAAEVRP